MTHTTTTPNGKPRAARHGARPPLTVTDGMLQRLTDTFKMLSDPSRLKIMLALGRDGELHVSALCELLGQAQPASQPAVSHHLTLLRMAGLVGYRRDGKHNWYYLEPGRIRDLLEQFFAETGNGQQALTFEDFALQFKRS